MSILITFLTVVLCAVSLFLVLVVLIQKPRSDSGVGAAMGGGMAEATFGAETGNVLTRATIIGAIVFFVLAFALYLGQLHVVRKANRQVDALPAVPASVAPAAAPATPAPDAVPAPEQPAKP